MRLSLCLAPLAFLAVHAVSTSARAEGETAVTAKVGSEGSAVVEAKSPPQPATSAPSASSPLPFPTATLSPEMTGVFCRIASFRDGLPLMRKKTESAWLVVSPKPAGATAGLEVRF